MNSNFGILFLKRLWVFAKVAFFVFRKDRVETERGVVKLNGPTRLRLFLETMGGGFIKLGQTLVLYHEVLPVEYAKELLSIKNHSIELPFDVMNNVFFRETGRRMEDLMAELDKKPIASTSTAQIYKGRIHGGGDVTIKIQRPHAREILEADYGVVALVLHTMGLFGLVPLSRVEEIISYFVSWTRNSLNFIAEAQNADILNQHGQRHSSSVVPKQYLEYCTSKVLVQEFIDGAISLEDVIRYKKDKDELLGEKLDPIGVLECFINDELREYFVDGFFHATPHPSNLIFTENYTTVHLDFGIVGQVDPRRMVLMEALSALSKRDAQGFCDRIFEFGDKILQDEMEYYLKADLAKRRREEKILDKIKILIAEDFKKDAVCVLEDWFANLENEDADIRSKMAIYPFAKMFSKLAGYGVRLPREINLFLRALFLLDFIGLMTSSRYNLVSSLDSFFNKCPRETLEHYIATEEYSKAIRPKFVSLAELDWEFFKESAAAEKERIMAARERINELIGYYGERYEEIGSMIKNIK